MKFHSPVSRNFLVVLAVLFLLSAPRASAQAQADGQTAVLQTPAVPARITRAIDETQLVRITGDVHPLARPEFDHGAVSPSMPLRRMLLNLRRSPEQQATLSQLMIDQYNTASPNYHKWVTPEEFGAQFGPADSDIQIVTAWLQSHGFQVARVTKGKLAIEFSGTAGQVKQAFHTEIHKFLVNGEQHFASVNDLQVPAALLPVIHGLAPLNNFRPKPMHRMAGTFSKSSQTGEVKPLGPEFTLAGNQYAIAPTDFATIYNVLPLWNAASAVDGTGQSIAVVGVSNINLQDITDFRSVFGLPATVGSASSPPVTVVIDGADPGVINDGSETEALVDTEWSGAVAKGAQIHLVTAADTDLGIGSGLLLAMFNVIDNNSDPVLSVSFGFCEIGLGASGNSQFLGLWEQAAAQGITVAVAAGDTGSAGCENQNANSPNPATTGLQVSGYASTPFNVAVGGTDFNDIGTQTTYFNATNDANTQASAKGYIPETTWNETCTNAVFGTNPEADCNNTAAPNKAAVITVGGSGGPSRCATFTAAGACSAGYAKPAFQSFISAANGMPPDGVRDLPDVSLFASSGIAGDGTSPTPLSGSFYALCEADGPTITPSMSCKKGTAFQFLGIAGTSVSSPAFAGIMALVNQLHGRQGNANFVIYKMAQQQFAAATACASVASPLPASTCTFNDVTTGTIAMPCAKASTNCTPTVTTDTYGVLPGYNAGAGYDLATGLGSINANNFVNNWANAASTFTSTNTTLSITPATGITAGSSVTVNVTVTPTTGTATPSGDVALVSNAQTGEGVDGFTLDSTGKVVNGTTTQLTGGTYQVTARYGGDGTFAPSVSSPFNVTVGQASSTTTASVLTGSPGAFVAFTSGTVPVTLFLQATVNPATIANNSPLTPTGTVTFLDNGTAVAAATNVVINQSGKAFTAGIATFTAGAHSIVAQYNGDPSYKTSSSTAVSFTLSAANPTISSLTPASGPVGTSVTIAGTNFGATQGTSTVTFNGTAGTPTSWSAASIVVPVPTGATTGNVIVTAGGVASNAMTFTVSGTLATSTALMAAPTSIASGGSVTLTATVTSTGTGASPTGTVQFKNGTTSLGSAVTCTAVSGASVPTCATTMPTTLAFLPPPAGPQRLPHLRVPTLLLVGLAVLILMLVSVKRVPGRYRRVYACAGLLLLVGLVAGLATGCGGGYGGGGGGGGLHYDQITATYSGDATYAGSTSAAVQITIQ